MGRMAKTPSWQMPKYKDATPARPEDEHPFYQTWLEREAHLKRNLDDACVKIAELTVENKELKREIKDHTQILPKGSQRAFRRDKN